MPLGREQHSSDQQHRVGQSAVQRVPHPTVLHPPVWQDFELLDSGDGQKLERYGDYRLVRPETQALWSPVLTAEWEQADAVFQRGRRGEDGGGEWELRTRLPEQWKLRHEGLSFWARLTPFRHTGVFPEHSAHWGWIRQQLALHQQPNVLVLFGYTGLHTLVAAQAGARVCHVDASKPATRWAQENQELSGLQDRPIRWIVDDVGKFVKREIRRGSRYDMIIMDPPVFGRGPKGEIWRLHEALQSLLLDCTQVLSQHPVGLLINAYATNISPITLANVMQSAMGGYVGEIKAGELVLVETAAARMLPTALYARWSTPGEC